MDVPSRRPAGERRTAFRVEGDLLYQGRSNVEIRYRRESPPRDEDPPYIGAWHLELAHRALPQGIEYTRDGLAKVYVPFPKRTTPGTYNLVDKTFTLHPTAGVPLTVEGHFRLEMGCSSWTRPTAPRRTQHPFGGDQEGASASGGVTTPINCIDSLLSHKV